MSDFLTITGAVAVGSILADVGITIVVSWRNSRLRAAQVKRLAEMAEQFKAYSESDRTPESALD